MTKTFIAVRDVDEETFRKFKAMSVEERMKLGVALTIAMKYLLEKKKKRKERSLSGVEQLMSIKPFSWGKGTEKTSKEVDEILYGMKK